MNTDASIWQSADAVTDFLTGMRGAIPFAGQQLLVTGNVLAAGRPVRRVLDVGCGDGVVTAAVLARFPEAEVVGVDFSKPMLDAARQRLGGRVNYVLRDFTVADWAADLGRFDAVVSGFAIHHHPDECKQAIYRAIHSVLHLDGWFVHIEHVAPASFISRRLWEQQMVDAILAYHHKQDATTTYEDVYRQFVERQDRDANILTPLCVQLDWLTDIGFVDVDCFFKSYELAVFGGRKIME